MCNTFERVQHKETKSNKQHGDCNTIFFLLYAHIIHYTCTWECFSVTNIKCARFCTCVYRRFCWLTRGNNRRVHIPSKL